MAFTAQRAFATLKQGAPSAGRASDAITYVGEAVEQLGALLDCERCSILLVDGTRLQHAATIGLPDAYVAAIDGIEIGPAAGSCGIAAYSGRTCVSEDIESDPRWDGYRGPARVAGLRSCWSVPLRLPGGDVLGTFATYSDEPFAPAPEQVELVEAYASIVALGLDNVRRKAEIAASYEAAVLGLTSALDVRDEYTGSRSTATSRLVHEVCARLGLDERETETAARVAALHDVGKLGIPTEILTRRGPLTPEQMSVMRGHPVIGEQIVRQIPGMDQIATAVRHEHERWDGQGYPDGIAGERIPLPSRIVFACDAYHAMVSDRPYRAALSHADAVVELERNAGTQFDPAVVRTLLDALSDGEPELVRSVADAEERERRAELEALAAEAGAEDLLVFSRVGPDTFSHLAGTGRGQAWAGNIELPRGDSHFEASLRTGLPEFLADPDPISIIGPYYARSAVVVPAGADVLVIFGSASDSLAGISATDAVELAGRVATSVERVPAAKRLADELEVLDAVRAVTTVAVEGVEATLSQLAERAATALSCEFATVIVDAEVPVPRIGWSARGWLPGSDPASTKEHLRSLGAWVRATGDAPILIEDAREALGEAPPGFGHEDGVASLHAVNIDQLGVLVLVYAASGGHGFTSLRRRIVRSLADGAEVAIRRALAQEQLSRENAQLERRASTDSLTALSNRGGWDEIVAAAENDHRHGERVAVALFDLDGLKDVNDAHGHAAGDLLLRSFATLLDGVARSNDFVARIGGDEFAALLRDCGSSGALAWCDRVLEAVEAHNAAGDGARLRVSAGCAAADLHGSVSAAIVEADRDLYAVKADQAR